MKKIRVMAFCYNNIYLSKLISYLNSSDELEVIHCANDGELALNFIRTKEADVVLLDWLLPSRDGLSILEELLENPIERKTIFIMMTEASNDYVTKRAMDLGVSYYFVKPIDLGNLVKRIRQLVLDDYQYTLFDTNVKNHFDTEDTFLHNRKTDEENISIILQKIGISSNLLGYKFLKASILYTISNPEAVESITKVLYPFVAKQYSTTAQRVERAMRHAIETAWDKGGSDKYCKITDNNKAAEKKPPNSEFIASISDYIKMNSPK